MSSTLTMFVTWIFDNLFFSLVVSFGAVIGGWHTYTFLRWSQGKWIILFNVRSIKETFSQYILKTLCCLLPIARGKHWQILLSNWILEVLKRSFLHSLLGKKMLNWKLVKIISLFPFLYPWALWIQAKNHQVKKRNNDD